MSDTPDNVVYLCCDFDDRPGASKMEVFKSALGAIKHMEAVLKHTGAIPEDALPKVLYSADRGTFGVDWYSGESVVCQRGVIVRREVKA